MEPIDVWRAAGTLIKLYGPEEAALTAARRTDALLDQGDVDGYLIWKKIVEAIEQLQKTTREPGETVN